MTSLTAERPLREGHPMDRAPGRTGITIRVYEVDPETLARREVRAERTWSIYRDEILSPKSPVDLAPCTCVRCGVTR